MSTTDRGIDSPSKKVEEVETVDHATSGDPVSGGNVDGGYSNENEEKIGYTNDNDINVGYGNESVVANEPQKENNDLNKERILVGSDGIEYVLEPWLSEETAKKIREEGIFLKKGEGENEGKFSSFLGGGAFGKFYVAFKKENKEKSGGEKGVIGIKVITKNLEENEIEATMQRDLTIGVRTTGQESRLMPIYDIINERDDKTGKLIRLNLVMPLASFGNVNSLREKLKEEKDPQLKRLVSKLVCKDLLIGMWQMHNQGYYHLDIKLDNMVVTSQGKIYY